MYHFGNGIGLASLKVVDTVHSSHVDDLQPVSLTQLQCQITQQCWQEEKPLGKVCELIIECALGEVKRGEKRERERERISVTLNQWWSLHPHAHSC